MRYTFYFLSFCHSFDKKNLKFFFHFCSFSSELFLPFIISSYKSSSNRCLWFFFCWSLKEVFGLFEAHYSDYSVFKVELISTLHLGPVQTPVDFPPDAVCVWSSHCSVDCQTHVAANTEMKSTLRSLSVREGNFNYLHRS